MRASVTIAIVASLVLASCPGQALAQRGGRGGGFRGGGGGMRMGGYRGGMGMGGYRGGMPARMPSFNRTPSYNVPAARPNLPQARPGGYPGNIAGRPGGIPGNVAGRPGYAGNIAGRPGYPGGPGQGAWANGRPAWSYRPGWAYHQGWINGYWHGANNLGWNNWGGGLATGLFLGGIGAWGLGSSLWNWGYMPYSNPYYVGAGVVNQPAAVAPAYDYSQPLSTDATAPDESVADPAIQTFDAGRASFLSGDYDGALAKTDEALKSLPNDAALHEFRALCLFALKRYDEAAATLYAVLSAGPGWDWTTMVRLYPDGGTYTAQLRALEAYINANPGSAPARFVLAYHYLTQGFTDAAVAEFREVVKIQPSDTLSAQLAAQLSAPAAAGAGADSAAAPAQAPDAPAQPLVAPAKEGNLVGTWKASPGPETTIELVLGGDGRFRWTVTDKGKARPMEGTYAYGNGILTLSRGDAGALVGRVTWPDDGHFVFQAMGGGSRDPGLTFGK